MSVASPHPLLRIGVAVAVCAGIVAGWAWWRAPEATQVKAGDVAPELELPTLGGAVTKLSSLRGRPVLLVMFLSGCKQCEENAPDLEKLHRAYLRRGLVVVAVSVDPDRDTLRDFVRRHGVTYFVMEDFGGAAVREAWGSWQMPEAYLIDPAGRVAQVWVGSVDWLSPAVRNRIEPLLPDA